MQSMADLLVRIPLFNLFRLTGRPILLPVNYTISVTNVCQSRCKTCFIWKLYMEKPELRDEELSTSEWLLIFEGMGRSPFWVTVSGGEPFLRADLVELCRALCEVNRPKIINIPTNGLAYGRIRSWTPRILDSCLENDVVLFLNLSIDGVGELHDYIRGVKGNWEVAMRTLRYLYSLKEKYDNLVVGIHTVISRYNVKELPSIASYIVEELKPDQYIMEVAEKRSELFNIDTDITPGPRELRESINMVVGRLARKMKEMGFFTRIGAAFRMRYYELLPDILREGRQLVPCMAMFASCHISAYGDLWPCCILGYEASVGNLRDHDYDIGRLWGGDEAKKLRASIRDGRCSCPLANAHYTNLLLSPRELLRIASYALKNSL